MCTCTFWLELLNTFFYYSVSAAGIRFPPRIGSTEPNWNQFQFSKPIQCLYVGPAYIVLQRSMSLCCKIVCKQDRSETQFRLELPTQIRGKQIRVRTGRNWVTLEGSTKPGKTTRNQRQGGKKLTNTHTQFTRFYNPSAPSSGESVVFPTKNQIGFVCCKFSGFPQILGSGIVW